MVRSRGRDLGPNLDKKPSSRVVLDEFLKLCASICISSCDPLSDSESLILPQGSFFAFIVLHETVPKDDVNSCHFPLNTSTCLPRSLGCPPSFDNDLET